MRTQRCLRRRGNVASAMANAVTWVRVALAPAIVIFAVLGDGRLAFVGLLLAGATDVLDGYLARRAVTASRSGSRLDSAADFLVLVAVALALVVLHPEILRDNVPLLAATTVLYATSIGAPARASTRVAGAVLYGFALFTLGTGVYVAALLWIAAVALAGSSVDGILRATITRLVKARTSRTRSQAPQS